MLEIRRWKHVFKLDPDKEISEQDLHRLCTSATDGLIVGGTTGVTHQNTLSLLTRVKKYSLPCLLEISSLDAIVPGFDHYLIPFVLNANDPKWMLAPYHQAIKKFGILIPWQDLSLVGYCVLNPNSAVAKLTKSKTELEVEDILAYGRMASQLFNLDYFYIEYSGMYGDIEVVSQVYSALRKDADFENKRGIQILYGGGISSGAKALEMSTCADTVIVGNVIYEDIDAALATVPSSESM